MERKGISLIIAIISVLVLMILVGVALMIGASTPKQVQLAVFYNNISQIQDAVTIKILNNASEYIYVDSHLYKWVGVATTYTEEDAKNTVDIPFRIMTNGPEKPLILIDKSVLDETTLPEEEKTKYFVDESGIVYYAGFEYEGKTYYNRNTVTDGIDKEIVGDITKPTVEIIADTTDITNVNKIIYTIKFSEEVKGFTIEDIQVVNGTKGEFTKVNESEYTIVVTNNQDCIQTITVPQGVCTDLANNENETANKSININRTVPVVTITPNGTIAVKNISIKIAASGANELKADNEYEYCLTQNKVLNGTETWQPYISGTTFIIGTGLSGTYYIHTKRIYDIAGNYSQEVISNSFVFDNTLPADFAVVQQEVWGTSIKVSGSTTDNSLQTIKYYYSKNNGTTWEPASGTNATTYTFTGLTIGTTYNIKMKAVDVAGNERVTSTISILTQNPMLASKVKVGDFVSYSAGTWPSTVGKPTAAGTFGGYTAGMDKGTSVRVRYNNSDYSPYYSGWRVIGVSDGIVTLVSGGTPAVYLHGASSSSPTNINTWCSNNFINSTYASSARSFNRTDIKNITGIMPTYNTSLSSDIVSVGVVYWLPEFYSGNELYDWHFSLCWKDNGVSEPFGIRPVVVLKTTVKTNGGVGTQSNPWKLII